MADKYENIWKLLTQDLDTFRKELSLQLAHINDTQKDDSTPLIALASQDPVDLQKIEILLQQGANPNLYDKSGWTALMIACYIKNAEMLRLLLQYGASNYPLNSQQDTALDIAIQAQWKEGETLLKQTLLTRLPPDIQEFALHPELVSDNLASFSEDYFDYKELISLWPKDYQLPARDFMDFQQAAQNFDFISARRLAQQLRLSDNALNNIKVRYLQQHQYPDQLAQNAVQFIFNDQLPALYLAVCETFPLISLGYYLNLLKPCMSQIQWNRLEELRLFEKFQFYDHRDTVPDNFSKEDLYRIRNFFLTQYMHKYHISPQEEENLLLYIQSNNIKQLLQFKEANPQIDFTFWQELIRPLDLQRYYIQEWETLLESGQYQAAETFYNSHCADINWTEKEYQKRKIQVQIHHQQAEVKNALDRFDYEKADQLHAQYAPSWPVDPYSQWKDEHLKKHASETLRNLFDSYQFDEALAFSEKYRHYISQAETQILQQKAVCKYCQEHNIDHSLDEDQALALIDTAPNTLVCARAGSGKTRLIIDKILFEKYYHHLSPQSILALAFNKSVSQEMNHRLSQPHGFEPVASTFHKLALNLWTKLERYPNVLENDEQKNSESKKRYILPLIDKFTQAGTFWSDFYSDIKKAHSTTASLYTTLMKKDLSLPLYQKYAADFLFEHEISYHNKPLSFFVHGYLGYLNDPKLSFSTFWASAARNEIDKDIFINFVFETLRPEIQKKRADQEHLIYIELEHSQINTLSRDDFESQLKTILINNGLKVRKKSPAKCLEEFRNNFKSLSDELILQLIENYQSKMWNLTEIAHAIQNFAEHSSRTPYTVILHTSQQIYQAYLTQLRQDNKWDWKELFKALIAKLEHLSATGTPKEQEVYHYLKNLKLILIDEFQDFSLLFFKLIQSIKKLNCEVRLFCVGDDWQAINAWAGANLDFFNHFQQYIENSFSQSSAIKTLKRNYRSSAPIVNLSNDFMLEVAQRLGEPGQPTQLHTSGGCFLLNMSFLSNLRNQSKMIYAADGETGFLAMAIKQFLKNHPTKQALILARTNEEINQLEAYRKLFDPKNSVQLSTIHKIKGKQADLVILLAGENAFPSYNPFDCVLEQLFDINPIVQNQNLFYVALTRAKEKLCILGESDQLEQKYIKKLKRKLTSVDPEILEKS